MGIEDTIIGEGVAKGSKWDMNAKGRYYSTYNNALLFLEGSKFKIRYNEFSTFVEIDGRRYEDHDALLIKERMRSEMRLEVSVALIDEAVVTIAKRNAYHPVRQYLSGLKWDGTPRVEKWLHTYCGAHDDEYSSIVGKILLVAAVRRVFEPGCQFDTMIILEGDQGIGKSRVCRALGGDWYKSVSLTERDKDTIQLMQGAWIIEVPELAVFAKRDIESLRSFISNPIDTARFAYGRHDKQYRRQSVFIGTINPESNGYLMDPTGNRRFLPVAVKEIQYEKVEAMRDQLFAEAVQIEKAKFPIYVSDERIKKLIADQQKEREFHDDWESLIINYVNANRLDTTLQMTACDIYTKIIGGRMDMFEKRLSIRIGNIMRRIGCPEPKNTRLNGVTGRYFDMGILIENQRQSPATTSEVCRSEVDWKE